MHWPAQAQSRTSAAVIAQEVVMDHASNFAALLLLFSAVGTSPAMAQTPVEGSYERMDFGHQKIARALFEAQMPNTIPGGTPRAKRGANTINALTLDEI